LRWQAGALLLAAAVIAVASPAWLALADGQATYLWHPGVLVPQVVPFVVAAALWLPRGSRLADVTVWWCAATLCGLSALVTGAIVSDVLPMDGDMVALGFLAVAAAFGAVVLLTTAFAQALRLWRRDRHTPSADRPPPDAPEPPARTPPRG
jgi:hypothetical protein